MNEYFKQDDLERLCCAKEILENNYRYHYTLQELTVKLNTNEYKLKQGFKKLYQMSIYAYLTRVRIEKAKELLRNSDFPIKSIAARVGFKDISNFNKNFKKLTGVSPLVWRRANVERLL
jgi:AraC-type DNA-binding domain-containing proteins